MPDPSPTPTATPGQIKLTHVLAFAVPWSVTYALARALGLGAVAAWAIGCGAAVALAWPILRLMRQPPLFVRCPSCQRRHTRYAQLSEALMFDCANCGTTSFVPGHWERVGTGWVFFLGKAYVSFVMGEDGLEIWHRLRWPGFLGFWCKSEAPEWAESLLNGSQEAGNE